jgi:hypothetical protein
MVNKSKASVLRQPARRLKTFTQEEAKDLYRITTYYWKEARRCEEAGAYLAACVLIGSALEAMLMLVVYVYDGEALATGKIQTVGGKAAELRRLDLTQLLAVAKAADWLPSSEHTDGSTKRQRKHIGDLAIVIRDVRNLVHPARYVSDHYRRRVTKRYSEYLFEVLEVSRDWLVAHNMAHLRRAMAAEGLL